MIEQDTTPAPIPEATRGLVPPLSLPMSYQEQRIDNESGSVPHESNRARSVPVSLQEDGQTTTIRTGPQRGTVNEADSELQKASSLLGAQPSAQSISGKLRRSEHLSLTASSANVYAGHDTPLSRKRRRGTRGMKAVSSEYVEDEYSEISNDEDRLRRKHKRTPISPLGSGDEPNAYTNLTAGQSPVPTYTDPPNLHNYPSPLTRLNETSQCLELELVLQHTVLCPTKQALTSNEPIRSLVMEYLESNMVQYSGEVRDDPPEFVSCITWDKSIVKLWPYDCLVRTFF